MTLKSVWLNVPVGCFNESWNIQVLPLKYSFIYALGVLGFQFPHMHVFRGSSGICLVVTHRFLYSGGVIL